MKDAMQRINLNVPPAVRTRLRALAAQHGRTESEMARALLIGALEGAMREQFYRQVAEAQTAERSARDLQILRAFEGLDG
jgi:plasmid stability protein